MAFQRIRIKNTNVAGKIPGADKLDTAELCINLKDQKLYSKDADGNVFELGKTAVNNGPTPPGSGNEIGDLWWDGDFLLVWNGSEWEIVGAKELNDLSDVDVDGVTDKQVLVYDQASGNWVPANAAELAVDVDLGYTAAADKGTVTNSAGDDAELPLVDETNAGLMSTADYSKLAAMPGVISGPLAPNSPSPGDIWIDTGDCPPTINVWNDCDDPGNPTWKPIGGGGGGGCVQGPVQITSSNGTELNSTLTAVGGNGVDEGASLTATYEWTGAKTGTGSSIVADVEGNYTVTASITCVDGSVLRSSAVWTVSDSYVGMVNNTPPVIAVVGEGIDGAYEGNSLYVVTNATVLNGEIPSIVETQWFKDGVADGTGSIYTIGAGDEGAVITARQLFRDLRNNELLSLASNEITIVERPADAITFTAVITDDGTLTGNTPGHVLTASATNIVGGTDPDEYAYQWKSGGVDTVTTKTYTLVEGDVGKIITCDVTVAELDGSNAEVRRATYVKVIEIAGTINKPVVLAPADDAGSGDSRPIVTDAITAVEGGGVDTCETELIESVVYPLAGRTWTGNPIDPDLFFDGDPNTRTAANAGAAATATFASPIKMSSIYLLGRSPQNNHTITVNTDAGDVPLTYTGDWGDVSISPSYPGQWVADGFTEINSITFSTSGNLNWTIAGFQKSDPSLTGTHLIQDDKAILTFPSAQGFDCFEPGDVVQDPDVKIIDIDDSDPFTITVDGGEWYAPGDAPADENRDKVWSTEGVWTGNPQNKTGVFDGNAASLTDRSTITYVNNDEFIYTFQPAITGLSSVEFEVYTYGGGGASSDYKYQYNSNGWQTTTPNNEAQNTYVIHSHNVSSLESFGYKISAASNGGIGRVWVTYTDGTKKLLVDPVGDTKLVKETPYDTKLTLAGAKDLDVLKVGDVVKMGMDADVPYQPVSDSIVSVTPDSPSAGQTTLTLSDDTDLAYFRKGDVVQSDSNQSQVWSSGGDTNVKSGENWLNSFNGTASAPNTVANIGATARVTFPANTIFSKIELSFWCTGDQTQFFNVNGDDVTSVRPNSDSNGVFIDVTSLVTGNTLSYIEFNNGDNSNPNIFAGVKLDGKLLVDQGIVNPDEVKIIDIDDSVPSITVNGGDWSGSDGTGEAAGDTEVTCQSPLKAPTDWTVEKIEGNTLSLSHATPDDNAQVWVANDNQAGKDFFVTGPSIVDEPLLTADVRLQSSLFATTPADADTLNKYIWSITPDGGAEMIQETTSNPYTPTGLALDTWHTVTVTHRGNALGLSDPSESIKFKTGLTRNLYTYYKERVEVLENRLAGLEADEVVDDATDVTLLTAVANLVARVEALENP